MSLRGRLLSCFSLKTTIRKKLQAMQDSSIYDPALLDEAYVKFGDPELKSYEIGQFGRKLLELILNNIATTNGTLFEKMRELENTPVAKWTQSYMHLVRIFGNVATHPQRDKTIPGSIRETDILINLACIERILDFSCLKADGLIGQKAGLATP